MKREWWADFSDDSIAKRVQVAHYHLRIAQDMADGRFGGERAPYRFRVAIGRAQAVVIRLIRRCPEKTHREGS